jgi:hypothetical protein
LTQENCNIQTEIINFILSGDRGQGTRLTYKHYGEKLDGELCQRGLRFFNPDDRADAIADFRMQKEKPRVITHRVLWTPTTPVALRTSHTVTKKTKYNRYRRQHLLPYQCMATRSPVALASSSLETT